jgi:hypothetical protein
VPTIRLLWVEPPSAMQGWEGEAEPSVMDAGELEPNVASNFPGPAGKFRLLPEEHWRTLAAGHGQSPAPVFLHEHYKADMEKWVNSLPDAAQEFTIIARVRDAVSRMVDTRITSNPQAFSACPTVTSTEPTHDGVAVVGRCVVLRPAGS